MSKKEATALRRFKFSILLRPMHQYSTRVQKKSKCRRHRLTSRKNNAGESLTKMSYNFAVSHDILLYCLLSLGTRSPNLRDPLELMISRVSKCGSGGGGGWPKAGTPDHMIQTIPRHILPSFGYFVCFSCLNTRLCMSDIRVLTL